MTSGRFYFSHARALFAALTLVLGVLPAAAERRNILNLNGIWDVAEGSTNHPPNQFDRKVPVPGLVDMAEPAFADVGLTNHLREAFWYRRFFKVPQSIPAVAFLKIQKAAFGSQVFLNGQSVGIHWPSFTPGYFDLRPFLKGHGEQNELVIRVGASRNAVPVGIPGGLDFEKVKYIPGIFDDVELILSGTPHLVRVQAAPNITNQLVWVQALVRNDGPETQFQLHLKISEAKSGRPAGHGDSAPITLGRGMEKVVDLEIPLRNAHLWSPEDPFLYELEASTGRDNLRTRFGMREFHLDPASGHAFLNGRPYFLRGSNVTLYRFFEDPLRADRPWREEWVRRLHRKFRGMHWNALRYCIGFPPEMWYRIADEEGILIQDEFPLWHLGQAPDMPKRDELTREYTEWMQERWNHPCVMIWDAQNETVSEETGAAIQRVRHLDLSRRPWDNGWGKPQAPGDCFESHPYLAGNPHFRLSDMARVSGVPTGNPVVNTGKNAIIINEYAWLWLNRDGTPTTLTREVYKNLLGPNATAAERRHWYARYLAAKTEFWRARRACAGVLHFCGLGYSRPNGQTSDHFLDLETLSLDPEFETHVRDAFSPVGLMIDEWSEEMTAGEKKQIPVILLNDRYEDWAGKVRFRLTRQGEVLHEQTVLEIIRALGTNRLVFELTVPVQAGQYQMEAALVKAGSPEVRSLRDFEVLTPVQKAYRYGLAVGKTALASSSVTRDGVTYEAAFAFDGRRDTRWSSEFSDTQWLAVDLGKTETIARVELLWERACGKSYAIETSLDGQIWTEVYRTDSGKGGTEIARLQPAPARWVRFHGLKRATEFGYSLWEMRVFH